MRKTESINLYLKNIDEEQIIFFIIFDLINIINLSTLSEIIENRICMMSVSMVCPTDWRYARAIVYRYNIYIYMYFWILYYYKMKFSYKVK